MDLIFALFNVASSRDVLTAAAPMHASLFYQSLPLFLFVLHSFLHCRVGEDLWYARYGFGIRLALVLAGALLTLFFAWNVASRV